MPNDQQRANQVGRPPVVDCAIVGAGPAGLTAALYLARYRRSVVILHDAESRATRIPLTHNVPGFPDGIRGSVLIERMTRQAQAYGAAIHQVRISNLAKDGAHFRLRHDGGEIVARSVILATGIRLNQVDLPHAVHEAAIEAGCLRYCPICDGFEATGRRIAVLGSDTRGAAEALFLRQFAKEVILLPKSAAHLSLKERVALEAADITVIDQPPAALAPGEQRMAIHFVDRPTLEVDVLYPALGCAPRQDLAAQMNLTLSEEGCIVTDASQQTEVPGLFAAGDVVDALDQITVAIGHGAIASTKAHNYLRVLDNETLDAA